MSIVMLHIEYLCQGHTYDKFKLRSTNPRLCKRITHLFTVLVIH